MWKEFIRNLTADCEFRAAALTGQLDDAEARLGVRFPDSLRSLFGESDGVEGEYGLGLIWPLDRIVKDNLDFRRRPDFQDVYMPFDHLLFFADAGNGDQFAFPINADGVIHRGDVFAWSHEDDSRTFVAPSLREYLDWWLSGKIKL